MSVLTFAATGDSFITRHLPPGDVAAREVSAIINAAQVRFTNLETVLRRENEGFPSAQSGGTWASTPPEMLDDLLSYGFNAIAWANNHTLDYSYGGLEATQQYLDEAPVVHAGAGQNLAQAAAVRYIECEGGRVALIAATSTFHESWLAGAQRPEIAGRPGVNPLRFERRYRVSPAQLKQLQTMAGGCGINTEHNLRVKEGFATADKEGVFRFGDQLFEAADEAGEFTTASPRDLKRFEKLIDEAKRQADVVLVSIHTHEMKDGHKDLPPDFLVEFARHCIDHGAHAIIGHGPHILRGLEIYKQCPIFYSLGNFIFHNETVPSLPADFYEKYNLDGDVHVAEALETRSAGDTRGLGANPKVAHSVIARWEMKDGHLTQIELIPIEMGFGEKRYQRGWPRLTKSTAPLKELQQLSEPFGTRLQIRNGRAKVILK